MTELSSKCTDVVYGQLVYVFAGQPGFDPRSLLCTSVKIDGQVRAVIGVDSIAPGREFRLMVAKTAEESC